VDIAYKADASVQIGSYEAKIMNLDFTMNDGTPIQEELLTANIHVSQNLTSVEHVSATPFKARFIDNTLRVESPCTETVTVYSVTGARLYSAVKDAAATDIVLPLRRGSAVIVRGSKSGTVKAVKQQ
jgi:hypothetical protein